MSRPTLFVAIASYKDPLLTFTVQDALGKAAYPDRVRFGIVDQCDESARWPMLSGELGVRVQYLWVPAVQTRGACWARALAQSLYMGETLYCQIDAHMAFPPGWDEWVVETVLDRMAVTPQCVVSSYPPNMTITDGTATIETLPSPSVLTHRVKESAQFDGRGLYLDFESWAHLGRSMPIRGHHVAAGLLLAPGVFAEQFPYDPHLYYLGEEQMLALRLFTHGWEIWHPVDTPIGHRYNGDQDPTIRPVHWSDDPTGQRPIPHTIWEGRSYRRQRLLCGLPGYGGAYGLGTVRSLADFAAWTGIDYLHRTIDLSVARALPPEDR